MKGMIVGLVIFLIGALGLIFKVIGFKLSIGILTVGGLVFVGFYAKEKILEVWSLFWIGFEDLNHKRRR